ncbi:CHAT domain-containing protein, partial [Kalaharituber pfeilii]
VLERLPSHNIVHFACHGVVHATDPLASCLLLEKPAPQAGGTSVQDRLEVRDIIAVRPAKDVSRPLRVAYLSACSSACDLSADAVNESLHIASTLQLAGFDNVIGTLWDSYDEACAEVAKQFYKFLLQEDVGPAEALHMAVETVRREEKYWSMPRAWAGFICWGA